MRDFCFLMPPCLPIESLEGLGLVTLQVPIFAMLLLREEATEDEI